ncbi:MAG: YbjN domain-containing protein, partial [Pseudomonadota bacterium]
MRRQFTPLIAGLVLAVPTLSPASDLVPADAWEVIHIAREFGDAEVQRDGMKDPEIAGAIASGDTAVPYNIGFYGCSLGRDCTSVLFSARLSLTPADDQEKGDLAAMAAEWNEGKLFGRAWLDDKGNMVLDHALAMGRGVHKQA